MMEIRSDAVKGRNDLVRNLTDALPRSSLVRSPKLVHTETPT